MNGVVSNQFLDLESRTGDGDHEDLRLWLRLLSCSTLVESAVRRLMTSCGTTLPRFDLLAQLERVPEGLKMGELSQRMMVSGGNVTAITDSLEREGLVRREPDSEDRRASRVVITRRGLEDFHELASAHEELIVRHFAALSVDEKQALGALLQQLKQHVRERLEEERVA